MIFDDWQRMIPVVSYYAQDRVHAKVFRAMGRLFYFDAYLDREIWVGLRQLVENQVQSPLDTHINEVIRK